MRTGPGGVTDCAPRARLRAEAAQRQTYYCATAPALANVSGRYYEPVREAEPSALARDAELARRLWEVSGRLTEVSAHLSAAAESRAGLAS